VTNVMAMGMATLGIDNELFLTRDGLVLPAGRLLNSPITNAIDVAANSLLGAVVRPDGIPSAFGATGPTTNIPPGLANVSTLDGGQYHLLALLSDRAFPPVFLPAALNASNLVVSSKSSPQWFGQTNVAHDGVAAAQSAPIDRDTQSSMRTLVNGPITVSFWWKVSSETNHDFLTFSIGGVAQASISGEQDWQQATFNVPAGPQMLIWTYAKDGAGSAGLDAGWVDQLTLIPQPPSLLTQPASQTVLGGSNVMFNVTATGTPPLAYQWLKNGSALSSVSGSSLSLTNVSRTNSGLYAVLVTNLAGTNTSSNAVLKVLVPQQLAQPVVLPNGAVVFFSSDVGGGLLPSSALPGFSALVSTDLVNWVVLPNALSITNGFLMLQDPDQTNSPARFYRIVEQ
jgi:hypothetical protein